MCGILGGNNNKWNYKNGIESLRHRGPDGVRIKSVGNITLAFARLSIIDLSDNAMQPMLSYDEQVAVVFNGEIYGYKKLREELVQKGYKFRSSSDTEVVLNAYLEWGEKFILKVDGMFGIAIYDRRDETIRLFRDRVGIKPLYYYYDGKNFGFASELKGILNMCDTIRFQIDNTAVYDYVNYMYIPEPKTYYKNVYKMKPGHRMIFDVKSGHIVKDSSYWKLNVNSSQASQRKQTDLVYELKELIKESVEEQMVADVPVGTFLSGGVDSGIVTYEGHRVNPQLETFTIGFNDTAYNELRYARDIADKYNITMNSKIFTPNIFARYYRDLKKWYDEPFADTSAFPTYLVSELAKGKVTVALTGDGGDEVFGGYGRYKSLLLKEKEKAPDALWISQIYNMIKRSNKRDYYWNDSFTIILQGYGWLPRISDNELRKRFHIDKEYDKYWAFKKYFIKDLPPVTRAQYLDFNTYLPGDILTKVDRTSMAVSLEVRVPLLAQKLVEFSFALSEEDRCTSGELKGLLKKAYEKELGKKLMYRKKMGFSIPYSYYKGGNSPQEQILKDIWNQKI